MVSKLIFDFGVRVVPFGSLKGVCPFGLTISWKKNENVV